MKVKAINNENYCGLSDHELRAYPKWSQIPGDLWGGIVLSFIVALCLQWGTTGGAILIAYLTPVKGLGCRSGGYLLYGTNATIVFFLLSASSFFSHSTMLRFQEERQPPPQPAATLVNGGANGNNIAMAPLRRHTSNNNFSPTGGSTPGRPWLRYVPVRGLAAFTRYAGKTLAVLNTFFLIAISLFEFTGGFDNCWCQADTLSLGQNGWITLFKLAPDLKEAASLPWGLGITLSIVICMVSYGIFWASMYKDNAAHD